MVHLSIDTSTDDAMGVEVAVNDAVSISYSSEEHEAVDKGQSRRCNYNDRNNCNNGS